jgi:hypothetical protein
LGVFGCEVVVVVGGKQGREKCGVCGWVGWLVFSLVEGEKRGWGKVGNGGGGGEEEWEKKGGGYCFFGGGLVGGCVWRGSESDGEKKSGFGFFLREKASQIGMLEEK